MGKRKRSNAGQSSFHRMHLVMNLQILTGTETGMTERIAIEDLLGTLELATPEEKKKLMQANVAEVQIP